jgi:chromosome segregation ATPase
MRLLSLEVGSLKAELLRERQKRTAAVERAEVAEAAQQSARERAAELQFATSRLAAQVEGLREEAAAKGRRVRQLSSSLAATDADMSTRVARGQLQVGGGLACVLC